MISRSILQRSLQSKLLQNTALSVLAMLLVALTGGAHSPVICLLYPPILLASVRDGARAGLLFSLGMAMLYCVQAIWSAQESDPLTFGVTLSLPVVAIVASLLHKRHQAGYAALHHRTHELSTLLDMSQMMDAAFDLDMTLNLILLNVQKLTGCQVCAVYLKAPTEDRLDLRAVTGPRDRAALLPSIALAEARSATWSVLDASAQPGESVPAFYVPDVGHSLIAPTSRLFDLDHRARSFVCLSLTCVEGLLGMLYLGCDLPEGLTEEQISLMQHLAARAAFPLQRVLLQQGFESLAYSDAMTGLDNYRQFERTLDDELRRAERYDHKLSVLLLDIDHFKKFNDTLGHQAGDALLGQLAMVLRNTLRTVDKPARYGGEEFVIICPETGKEEARLIAERVRRAVAETPFALVDKGQEISGEAASHVTVSLGFATFPQDAHAARDLVKKADFALYAAKTSGRNAVRGHEDVSRRLMVH